MVDDVNRDQLVVIKIEGMHCHKCQQTIQTALQRHEGVHEVEVDFPSHQASVLFNPDAVSIRQLMATVVEVGYKTNGFSRQRGAAR